MVVGSYALARYLPGGEMAVMGTLNSLVHSVMYSYYFYCLYNNSRQNIWWKKYITQMQLVIIDFALYLFTFLQILHHTIFFL